ncbi:hypothetical protein M434DRAFT_248139 [Hypoxylon sp. CO27-5]|nr:hypothetical protein M434DRAFT_248139 [Hypoxylon sp. CO27-5]
MLELGLDSIGCEVVLWLLVAVLCMYKGIGPECADAVVLLRGSFNSLGDRHNWRFREAVEDKKGRRTTGAVRSNVVMEGRGYD